jgi:hypothetical protein
LVGHLHQIISFSALVLGHRELNPPRGSLKSMKSVASFGSSQMSIRLMEMIHTLPNNAIEQTVGRRGSRLAAARAAWPAAQLGRLGVEWDVTAHRVHLRRHC